MKCIDCDKVFLYPVVERDKETAMCPVCFGSNLSDVTLDELEFARRQQWYFNKPEPAKEIRVTMIVIPFDVEDSWWLGYVLHEGEKFQLLNIGSEAEIDPMLEAYKLSGGMMKLPLKGIPGKYEEVQVQYAVKLHASEAFRIVPRASEVIDTRGKTDEEEPTEPERDHKQYPSH